ncbi:FAS1 domain-containing protein [Clavulina sp. PMI_390]|nr:FAS1 domain-containing protein [Clavulina sp. PMI_390]
MRVAIGLLCSLFSLVAAGGDTAQQPISTERVNLVDHLSNDPDFTLLLRLLQRARLIPTLNRLEDATLFAPTNEAIERYQNSTSSSNPNIWDANSYSYQAMYDSELIGPLAPDNVQFELRQHLLYHLLNYSLPLAPSEFPSQRPLALDTLLFPDVSLPPPTDEPAPAPPWLPLPGGSLNDAPQRLRVASREDAAWVGVDFAGRGGAQVTKAPVVASNGLIIPVSDVITMPGNLYDEILLHPLLHEFTSILTPEMIATLKSSPHLTMFLPIDSAWSAMDDIQRRYLHSGYAERDVSKLVGLHLSGAGLNSSGDVGWSDSWEDGTQFTTAEGQQLTIGFSANGTVQVGPSTVVQEDIYAANGVLHIVSDLLIQPKTFKINAEKYLLALNATGFVGLLRRANLSHYVDDEHDGTTWTILAPRDDVITMNPSEPNGEASQSSMSITSLLEGDAAELDKVLKYHFIPGKLTAEDLIDGALLGTELREDGLDGSRQRLPVTVKTGGKVLPNVNGEVGFGNARVIADPIEKKTFTIYMVSQVLKTPVTTIERLETSSKLSTFVAAAYASEMTDRLRTQHSTTLLVPQNGGFDRLGLVTDYLLLPSEDSRRHLRKVIKHHMLQGVYYASDLGNDTTRTIETHEGTTIVIANSSIVFESGLWNRTTTFLPQNDITSTGVIHHVKDVILPETFQVDIEGLARAADGETMITLVKRSGLGKVLNGTLTMKDLEEFDPWRRRDKPPTNTTDGSTASLRWARAMKESPPEPVGWVLLVPKESAFKSVNLTRLLDDEDALRELVMQHIIPIPSADSPTLDPEFPLAFTDEAQYSTLLTPNSIRADLVFRITSKSQKPIVPGRGTEKIEVLVGIKNARGSDGLTDFAKVLNFGRTTTPAFASPKGVTGPRSGVLQIDQVLQPWVPDWWNSWGKYTASGAGGGVLIICFWATILWFWHRKNDEATYEPLDGDGTGED